MPSNTSSNSSSPSVFDACFSLETSSIILILLIFYVFWMPVFVFVLVLGYQKWRKQRFSSSFTLSSHIDIFTYNMAVIDLLGILGMFSVFFGLIIYIPNLWLTGICLLCITSYGHMMLHLVTCIERYLAVVHPIIYLQLRGSAGVMMRNIIVGCVWLISLFTMCAAIWFGASIEKMSFVFLSFTSVGFIFSSISVLCALVHPGPGKRSRDGVHTDQSKHKAFQTMVIITGTLSLRFLGNLITLIVQGLSVPNGYTYCVVGWALEWFSVPSNLVLPLLFLQRAGKLKVCRNKSTEKA